MICASCQLLKGDQIKENGMAGVCDVHGREVGTYTGFGGEA